jgi:hypothetical protein
MTNVAIDDDIGSVCATRASGEARCWGPDSVVVGDLGLPAARYVRVQDTGMGPIGLTNDGQLFGAPGVIPPNLPPIADFQATNFAGSQGLCLKTQDGGFFWGPYLPAADPPMELQFDAGPFADAACAYRGLVCGVKSDGTTVGGDCPTGDGWAQVSISVSLKCGLTRAGDIACVSASVAAGTAIPRFTNPPYRQLATAYQAACAIDAEGALRCVRSDGELVAVDPGPYLSIVAGRDLVCGIRPDGGAGCFRQNAGSGEIGTTPTFTAFSPIAPPIDSGW